MISLADFQLLSIAKIDIFISKTGILGRHKIQVNLWIIKHILNCGEIYKDMFHHRSYVHKIE